MLSVLQVEKNPNGKADRPLVLLHCSFRSETFVMLKYFKLIPLEKHPMISIHLFFVKLSQSTKLAKPIQAAVGKKWNISMVRD